MINFKSIFDNYSKVLDQLKNDGIAKSYYTMKDSGLSADEQNQVFSFLKKSFNLVDTDDGNNSLLAFLDFYHDRPGILKTLLKLKDSNISSSLKAKLSSLISDLEKVYNCKQLEANELGSNAYSCLTASFAEEELSPEIVKTYSYAEFAYNKSINKDYFPTEKVSIDTSHLKHLSREELIDFFHKDKFFDLSKTDRESIMQAIVNDYCAQNGIEPCAVVFENLPLDPKHVCYGQYNPNKGTISINKKLLDNMEQSNNPDLGFQLLSTLVHEARHRKQYSDIANYEHLDNKSKAVVNSLETDQADLSHSAYLSSLDELDARNAALEYLKTASLSSESDVCKDLRNYYNYRKQKEMNNGKNEISEKQKAFFSEIYDGKLLDVEKDSLNK